MTVTELRNKMQQLQNTEANLILNYIDEGTGEIPTNTFEALQKLGHTKEVIVNSAVESHNEFLHLIAYIDSKLKTLNDLKKTYSKTSNSIKNILKDNLIVGEKIHSDSYMISWRKSSSVEIDDFLEPTDIEAKYPHCIKTEKTFIKAEIKKLLKAGISIEGVEIIENQNLQIK